MQIPFDHNAFGSESYSLCSMYARKCYQNTFSMGILSKCWWFGTALFSMVCICLSFILPVSQRKASQKKIDTNCTSQKPTQSNSVPNHGHLLGIPDPHGWRCLQSRKWRNAVNEQICIFTFDRSQKPKTWKYSVSGRILKLKRNVEFFGNYYSSEALIFCWSVFDKTM